MKIIGFGQLRNEASRGNLENWFRCMEPCNHIYIFDQASTDNSREIYEKYKHKTTVIYSPSNRFNEELICKGELYRLMLKEQPDVDWVLWLDGDLILDGRLLVDDNLRRLCKKLDDKEIDFVAKKDDKTVYIQVAYLISDEKTHNREFGNLLKIHDSYPKMVISMDELIGNNYKGIEHWSVRKFLLEFE